MSRSSVRPAGQRAWGAWLASLCLLGAWTLASVSPAAMRGHWDTAAAWMFTLACCGVTAEAVWNGRDHCARAARVMGMGVAVTALLAITSRDPSAVPGVSWVVLSLLAVSAFPLIRYVSDTL